MEMSEKPVFIWDLDGTLLDSYDAILAGLEETYERFQLAFDREKVKNYILSYSVKDLLWEVTAEAGLDFEEISAFRAASLREKNASVQLMAGAREVLDWTVAQGIRNFIYTHKGNNAFELLKELQVDHYFTEVLTSESGFKRKPHPEALLYLMDKYQLDKEQTYYIGDRQLDVETAQEAGIGSINLVISDGIGNQNIQGLQEIPELFSTLRKD